MPIFWLSENNRTFPDPNLTSDDGILAVGGGLEPWRLVLAYQKGLFPWYNPNDPILWWCPDPRFVLFPEELKVSKSMRTYFNNPHFTLSMDQQFEQVIRAGGEVARKGQSGGTWISEEMIQSYVNLHQLGIAHSVEVWQDGELVGGLYGLGLGRIFYGESMFARVSNASKFAFISLVRRLEELGYWIIDCQQETPHLKSLGGRGIPRSVLLAYMQNNEIQTTQLGSWKHQMQGRIPGQVLPDYLKPQY
ncbi:MAG: leucyl/phenylalanyl-tRNA--protein transferase [Bacteroidota bacterium]